ncbi:MAG: hypothetical protein KDC35_07525 [Acidobacteria bacterium]|nr:hypothetical protein [Acidobacteriota bacterium]
MRAINLTDHHQRDTHVAFSSVTKGRDVFFRKQGGDKVFSVRVIKNTFQSNLKRIANRAISEEKEIETLLIEGDPEIDFDYSGKTTSSTKTVYVDDEDRIAYHLRFVDVTFDPDGTLRQESEHVTQPSNITVEIPLVWTNKYVPLNKLARMLAFSKVYQLHHVNGLTYDFLFQAARHLQDKRSAVMIGAGERGRDPLRFQRDGLNYRAFLMGTTDGDRYRLTLHLSNLELKEFQQHGH